MGFAFKAGQFKPDTPPSSGMERTRLTVAEVMPRSRPLMSSFPRPRFACPYYVGTENDIEQMTPTSSQSDRSSLTSTLVLALTQCQEQVRSLAEHSQKVDDLTRENELLRQELEQYRTKSNEQLEAKYRAQFQDAFRQVAEKQSEIDRLKEKLRIVKTKARRRGLMEPFSTSAVSTSDTGPRSPHVLPSEELAMSSSGRGGKTGSASVVNQHVRDEVAPQPQKQLSSPIQSLRDPLNEIPGNATSENGTPKRTRDVTSKRRVPNDKGAAAIPELAEDGDDHLQKRRKLVSEQKTKVMPESVYHRLGDLLDARVATNPGLLRARSGSPRLGGPIPSDKTPARPSSAFPGFPTPVTNTRSKRPRSSLTEVEKVDHLDPDDEEPFRSKPLSRLGLKHFKVNPAVNEGLDYAYNQVVRGQERRCFPGCTRSCCSGTFKALAATLPNAQKLNGQPLSDHELLVNFLGPESEERIRKLTPKARENLIHEARTRLIADEYGKMHRNAHERGRSPPGFWRTDMPGSQERRDDLKDAKSVEKEEVKRRYQEAMKGGGRWMFADE